MRDAVRYVNTRKRQRQRLTDSLYWLLLEDYDYFYLMSSWLLITDYWLLVDYCTLFPGSQLQHFENLQWCVRLRLRLRLRLCIQFNPCLVSMQIDVEWMKRIQNLAVLNSSLLLAFNVYLPVSIKIYCVSEFCWRYLFVAGCRTVPYYVDIRISSYG